jgi:dihydroxyacetone kinase-like protein
MAQSLGYDEVARMIRGAVEQIRAHHEHLSQLDSALGDGDHGSAMLRAADAAQKALEGAEAGRTGEMLQAVAWAVMGAAGGAPGPLLGSLLLGMSAAAGGDNHFDSTRVAEIFESGLAGLRKQTKAQVGDKTMMDALVPAVEALRAAAEAGAGAAEAMQQAAAAAARGAESTRDLRAKFGKARNMGERTVGHVDPGATSICLIFRGFADGLAQGA